MRKSVTTSCFRTLPTRSEQIYTSADPESEWKTLEQVSLGTRLLIEQTDGTRLKGRFHSADVELRSVVMGKGVVGLARAAVRRVWLLGRKKVAAGALIGLVVGALWGGVLGSIAGAAEDEGAIIALLSAFFYGGVGAGIGAGIGAAIRKRRLIYRAFPTGYPTIPSQRRETMRETITPLHFSVVFLIGLSLLCPVSLLEGQEGREAPMLVENDWDNLARVEVGEQIEVRTRDHKTHKGKFLAYSEEAISLRAGKRDLGFRREEVLRITRLGPPNRRRAALKGLIIGAIPGALFGALVGGVSAEEDDSFGNSIATGAVTVGAVWGGIGAGVGALVARPSKTVIYRAPAANGATPDDQHAQQGGEKP